MRPTPDWQAELAELMQADDITHLRLGDQAELVAHPQPHACVLTLWNAEGRSGLQTLMHARWRDPARLGAWLPAQLADGQPAWLTHVPIGNAGPDWPDTGMDLDAALALLT